MVIATSSCGCMLVHSATSINASIRVNWLDGNCLDLVNINNVKAVSGRGRWTGGWEGGGGGGV